MDKVFCPPVRQPTEILSDNRPSYCQTTDRAIVRRPTELLSDNRPSYCQTTDRRAIVRRPTELLSDNRPSYCQTTDRAIVRQLTELLSDNRPSYCQTTELFHFLHLTCRQRERRERWLFGINQWHDRHLMPLRCHCSSR